MAKKRNRSNPKKKTNSDKDEGDNTLVMKSKAPMENTRITRVTRSNASESLVEKKTSTPSKKNNKRGDQAFVLLDNEVVEPDDNGEFAKAITRFQREAQLELSNKYYLNDGEQVDVGTQSGDSVVEMDNLEHNTASDGDVDLGTSVDEDATLGVANADSNGDEEAGVHLSTTGQCENSKQAAKRARKEKLSIEASLRNVNSEFRISEKEDQDLSDVEREKPKEMMIEDMRNEPGVTQKTKRTRGPTVCKVLLKEISRLEVTLNEIGQPIGVNSGRLSSYVGRLAREKVPLTYNDWRKVPKEKKECYWKAVMEKFMFNGREQEAKAYVLAEIGRLWRSHKSRLGTKLDEKPSTVGLAEWRTFVEIRSSKTFKEKSEKFKELRKKQTIPYTGGRTGFARIDEELKKEEGPVSFEKKRLRSWLRGHTDKNGEATKPEAIDVIENAKDLLAAPSLESPTLDINNDTLSQLIPVPERRSNAIGMGAGASLTKLSAMTESNRKVAKLEGEIASVSSKVSELLELLAKQNKVMDILMENKDKQQSVQNGHATSQDTTSQAKPMKNTYATSRTATPQVTTIGNSNRRNKTVIPQDKPIGDANKRNQTATPHPVKNPNPRRSKKCKLLNWEAPEEVVAVGRWVTDESNTVVHGMPLGRNGSKVWVDVVMVPAAPIWRPTSSFDTMDEALGYAIAWPSDHLVFEE